MQPADPLSASRASRFRVGLGAAVVLVLVGVGVTVFVAAIGSAGGNTVAIPRPSASSSPVHGRMGSELYVHVLGAVRKPGLYRLRDGDRAIDAIARAGGYTTDADTSAVNLARFLSDGEQISIPTRSESASGSTGNPAGSVAGGKVNLNSADSAALETLPRVGPALAARILAWRAAHGRFTAIEDLMSVSGIGEKTFAGLKDRVTI